MSQQERELMQQVDKIILNSRPKKLLEIQQIDKNTQLDGVWFYDIYTSPDQLPQKHNISINNHFKKKQ